MVASRARLGEQQRQKSREAIVDAAMRVFQEKTPDASVIGDFIAAAGVARGTFYNHFRTVDDVCLAVAGRLGDELNAAIIAAETAIPDPAERIAIAIRHFVRRSASDPKWAWVIVRVSSHEMENVRYRAILAPDVAAAVESGRIAYLNPEAAADLILGTASLAMRTVLAGHGTADYPEIIAAAVLRGLGLDSVDAHEVANRTLPSI